MLGMFLLQKTEDHKFTRISIKKLKELTRFTFLINLQNQLL
jgi:hypothetical protein